MKAVTYTNDGGAQASGWSAYEYPPGSWFWSAYGPRGGEQGKAHSRQEAEGRAKRAQENLR